MFEEQTMKNFFEKPQSLTVRTKYDEAMVLPSLILYTKIHLIIFLIPAISILKPKKWRDLWIIRTSSGAMKRLIK